jgi:hypothetical protein
MVEASRDKPVYDRLYDLNKGNMQKQVHNMMNDQNIPEDGVQKFHSK